MCLLKRTFLLSRLNVMANRFWELMSVLLALLMYEHGRVRALKLEVLALRHQLQLLRRDSDRR